jgi:hypothetical protein
VNSLSSRIPRTVKIGSEKRALVLINPINSRFVGNPSITGITEELPVNREQSRLPPASLGNISF